MHICWHQRWSVERDFMTLSHREQLDWLAWAIRDRDMIHDAVQSAYTSGPEGDLTTDRVTAQALIQLLLRQAG